MLGGTHPGRAMRGKLYHQWWGSNPNPVRGPNTKVSLPPPALRAPSSQLHGKGSCLRLPEALEGCTLNTCFAHLWDYRVRVVLRTTPSGAWMQHQDLGPPPPTDPTSGLPGPLLPHLGNRRRGKRHLGWTTWLTHTRPSGEDHKTRGAGHH